jgi:kynurenine formamidase
MNDRWKSRPPRSNWGDFGPDDQRGRLNLLTPASVKQAAAEVREGLVFCLSLPLDYPGGAALNSRRGPPVLSAVGPDDAPIYNFPAGQGPLFTDLVSDDVVTLALQYSTHWDALAHIGSRFDVDGDGQPEHVYYNGYRAGEDIVGPVDYRNGKTPTGEFVGARALGIENMAAQGVQGRGVLVDLRAHFGDERRFVGYDDLMRVIDEDRISIERGDLLLFHTGFGQLILDMQRKPDKARLNRSCCVLDGRDEKLLNWIADGEAVALISDNYGVEAYPAKPGGACQHALMPLHELCIFKLGMPLGELWYLTELAQWLREHGRSRFLLTAPPLRLPGAVGSPLTPIATV